EPGRYQVTETTAPSGYATAGPWDVDLTGGDAVLEVLDHALQGSVKVTKRDAVTHAPLAGARLLVRYDADRDGRFDTDVATFTSDARPRILDHLRPGDYQLSEAAPPPGYRPAARPAMFTVAPGRQAEVTLADAPRTSVTFAKSPPLAGAVFAVSDDRGHELGRCTSASDGRCHLGDDIFQPGQRLCWKEVVAPPGYATAAGECMTAAAGAMVVAVTDVALPVPVAVPERPVPPAQAVVKAQQIPAPVAAELPRTGGTPGPLVAIGDALLLAGWVFLAVGRLRRRRP
ncbi:MAG: hypothetical protein QOG64_2943, partial [Acidimicrobiaceae bacterium]|nr:hypothetical protein [Acidimicrobiaceae bacterium]